MNDKDGRKQPPSFYLRVNTYPGDANGQWTQMGVQSFDSFGKLTW